MSIRLSVILLLLGVELASMIALSLTPRSYQYYLVCIVFNALIVLSLIKFPVSALVDTIQNLNVIALIVQYFGFVSYWFAIPIVIYNVVIHAISFWQIWKIFTIGGDNGLASVYERHTLICDMPTLCTTGTTEKERQKCTTS